MRPQPDQMRRNPLQLDHHHADVLRAFWNFHPQKFFYRQAIHQVVPQWIQVIHPVRQRNRLRIRLVFARFLDPGMQIPEIGNRFHHVLAVKFQQNSQHPVRRRVLRPHVEHHGFCCAGGGINGGHGVELFLKSSPVLGTSR